MLRQKYLNGFWIGRTLGVNFACISIFHLVPFAFLLAIFATSIFAVFGFPWFSLAMWGAYALLTVLMTVIELASGGFSPQKLLLPFLFLLLHLSYGAGTLLGVISMPFWLSKIKK